MKKKEQYTKLEMDVICFSGEDVIRTSGGPETPMDPSSSLNAKNALNLFKPFKASGASGAYQPYEPFTYLDEEENDY